MVVRKLNYFKLISFIVVLCLMIFGIIKLITIINYRSTSEYKLLNIGYSQKEVKELTKNLKKDEINRKTKSEKIFEIFLDSSILNLFNEQIIV